MRTNKQQQHADETENRIKKYEFALKVFVALEHKLCSLEKMDVYQAKKLRLSGVGSTSYSKEVTPDMVVEASRHGQLLYRAIVEIKESLPTLPKDWNAVVAQLEKYKLVAGGWDTDVPDKPHDVMLATGMPHAKKVAAWAGKNRGSGGTGNWLIVVSVVAAKHDGEECIEIAKIYGKIAHPKIDRGLSPAQNCRISLNDIVTKVDQMKFYDSYPPIEYTMSILWDHVFSKFVHGKKLKKFKDNKKVLITVSMVQILKKMKTFAPRTNPMCIQQSWIKKAMSAFEDMRIVSHDGDGQFTVAYKKHSKPTTDWIVDRIACLDGDDARARRSRSSQNEMRIDDFI